MSSSLKTTTAALLIAYALLASTLTHAQDAPQTRPRRAQPQPTGQQARAGSDTERLTNEPTIRIGLSTDARSVTVSTNGSQLSATELSGNPLPLSVARVRLEAHLLAPPPPAAEAEGFKVEIAGAQTRAEAERNAKDIQAVTSEAAEVSLDATTNTWRVRVGTNLSSARAIELRNEIADAGFESARVIDAPQAQTTTARSASPNPVRPTARTGALLREVVAYSSGSSQIFNTSAPVTFSSPDERNAPVRFNEKPYRASSPTN
ncbi:MAG: SPOR domain-containing protein [Acidobacteriota bacterium]|nr:SPOR domain-containing protein [Acidobacteriota bacterium]